MWIVYMCICVYECVLKCTVKFDLTMKTERDREGERKKRLDIE